MGSTRAGRGFGERVRSGEGVCRAREGAKAREVSGVRGHRRFGPGVGGLDFRRMGPSRSWPQVGDTMFALLVRAMRRERLHAEVRAIPV